MDTAIMALLAIIAAETTYLSYKTLPKAKIAEQSMLIDTSVLIDGRILPIARSYLITAPLIIPRSVVRELQYMADKADHEKRERAREGLDMIEQLQRLDGVTVTVVDDKGDETGVDERLVELAQTYNARLCTVDYNLNKSARAQGVNVVNVNELAHALRIIHLPGETITLNLVQPGQESRQAVGYLDDGTMVVVDDAKTLIHQDVEAEITRVLQTSAGKMMFAKLVSKKAALQTRGDTEAGSRLFGSKKAASQTANDANDKSLLNAKASVTKSRLFESRPRTRSTNRSTDLEPRTGNRTPKSESHLNQHVGANNDRQSANVPVAAMNAPKQQAQQVPQESDLAPDAPRRQAFAKKAVSHNRRRRSPEDSLVDLANE